LRVVNLVRRTAGMDQLDEFQIECVVVAGN
jgi:hypothetical protein